MRLIVHFFQISGIFVHWCSSKKLFEINSNLFIRQTRHSAPSKHILAEKTNFRYRKTFKFRFPFSWFYLVLYHSKLLKKAFRTYMFFFC